ncbi:MAG: DUF4175 family protein [Gemmatimonadetes bacterium]|nr:DUF4175 family protein [Gemmatimonadota bacterium]
MKGSDRRMTNHRLIELVASIRWRWRTRIFLRGLTWVGALSGAVLFLSAIGLEQMRFSAEAVVWLRLLTWGTLGFTTIWFIVRPLFRRVTDEQVALYLEEHEPALEHAVVSALDAGNASFSPALGDQLVQSALDRARKVEFGRRVEQSALYRFAGALTAVAVFGLAFALMGPSHLRHGVTALLFPMTDAASVNPYSIGVLPGDTTISRGSDQMVTATLQGFDVADVSVFTRSGSDETFQRLSMLPDQANGFEVMLLAVDDRTEYFVEAAGIRSSTFSIDVADLPYVDRLDLTYYFPRYTGLDPRTQEDGGDIAALAGTLVEVRIHPTMATTAGQLIMDGEPVADLALEADGTLLASFTVTERGFYSIELARDNGEMVPASPEYIIDLLEDQAPSIRFSDPGRDITASPIEEVYLEVRADDDYGIGDIRLVYSVNGGEEDTLVIFEGSGASLREVSTGHTLFLEEWELEPGDLVAYYALVRDNRTRDGGKPVSSDMFFLSVRPFERAYRQAEQQGGGGGGGGQQEETALSEMQRMVISATFNLIRQEDSYGPGEFSENVVSVSLAQGRLKEQVATLLQRMQNRGLTRTDPGFRDVSAILPQAVEAMSKAEEDLASEELRDALPDEQTALRFLQQAEETYERYVTQQQDQQGGGGGGGQQAAEDLADLFELELDKLKNQYETVRRGQQQQSDNDVDELIEQLKELARRQEQEAERQRRRAQAQQGSAGGGQAQRDLAEQVEEAARQLQRLARENNDAQLEQTARDLQQAAESMRRSAAQGGSAGQSEAAAAQRRLEDVRRQLEEARADRARRDAENAIERVEELQRQQREVQREVRGLPATGAERAETINRLRERKDQMTETLEDLERELHQAAANSRADNPAAARALEAAAKQIQDSKLKEKLRYSRGTIEQWDPQSAVTLELDIESDLQALHDQLERAASASSERQVNPLEEALEEARELVRGMEAMDRRLDQSQRQAGQQGQEGQQGQGQQGQDGQGGQQGQDGQGGQQGQGGQRGDQSNQAGGGGPDGLASDRLGGSYYGGAVRGDPRPFSDEEIRQLRSEFGQRIDQVRALQERLREAGQGSARDLQAVLEAMARLEREGIYADPAQVAGLNEDILNSLKRLEFGLRREVEGEPEQGATLTGSDEVPDGYRELVEEYYRALARGRPGGGGN